METVSARIDDLDHFAGSLDSRSLELARIGADVSWTLEVLANTRSEFVGALSDHGETVRSHGVRLLDLGARLRYTATQYRIADGGALPRTPDPHAGVRTGDRPVPKSRVEPGPKNWGGLDPALIAQGQRVAAHLRASRQASALSEDEMIRLAAWWFDSTLHDDDKAIRSVVEKLSPADLASVRDLLKAFNWNAYANALARVPAEFESVMTFLGTSEAAKLNSAQLANEVKKRFHVTDPDVLDAINTVLRFEIGTANRLLDPSRGEQAFGDLIWGWYVPGLVPATWSDSLARGYDYRAVSPEHVDEQATVIMNLLQGRVLNHDDRNIVRIQPPQRGPGGVLILSLLAGAAAGALVAVAAPEAAITAAVVSALEAIPATAAAAPLLGPIVAPIVATALVGATGGVTAGVVGRTVTALITGQGWDDVIEPGTLARDAILGGITAMAAYGLGQAVSKLRARLAAAKPNTQGYKDLREELKALEAAQSNAQQARKALSPDEAPEPSPRPHDDQRPVTTTPPKDFGTAAVGARREQIVAEKIGGKVVTDRYGVGKKIIEPNVGSTDYDVLGPDGSYNAVGGPAKAMDLSRLSEKLRILKSVAKRDGVDAHAWFSARTPSNVIDKALEILGADHVHIFEE